MQIVLCWNVFVLWIDVICAKNHVTQLVFLSVFNGDIYGSNSHSSKYWIINNKKYPVCKGKKKKKEYAKRKKNVYLEWVGGWVFS